MPLAMLSLAVGQMCQWVYSIDNWAVRFSFAKGDIHRSLGHRPRFAEPFGRHLAKGHIQSRSIPDVWFIEGDPVTR
ncbi:MAG: hypothetical protein ACK48K_14075 [Planctomycetota bacterium]|jgi:hypothetical protein